MGLGGHPVIALPVKSFVGAVAPRDVVRGTGVHTPARKVDENMHLCVAFFSRSKGNTSGGRRQNHDAVPRKAADQRANGPGVVHILLSMSRFKSPISIPISVFHQILSDLPSIELLLVFRCTWREEDSAS